MSIERVPGSGLAYHLVAFDAMGVERDEPEGPLGGTRAVEEARSGAISDVFVFTHGWMGDVPGAKEQAIAWIGAMAACPADLAALDRARKGFRPLTVCLHWPSLPWGDEALGLPSGGIADTPASRDALAMIRRAALVDPSPHRLPAEVVEAYRVLDREGGLGADGPGAAPGDDRDPFDPEAIHAVGLPPVLACNPMCGNALQSLLLPLQVLSFWAMKARARAVGEGGAGALLASLQQAAPGARFHLMGHSFGGIVVASMLLGRRWPTRPVQSLAILQGAMSSWSFGRAIPGEPGRSGFFHEVVAGEKVIGPILTSRSSHDRAVGTWYPLAAGAARQVDFAPGAPGSPPSARSAPWATASTRSTCPSPRPTPCIASRPDASSTSNRADTSPPCPTP